MKLICAIALLLMFTTFAPAQEAAPASAPSPGLGPAQLAQRMPAPKPSDVDSLDGIVKAAYDSISGPMGPRDWKRFRSLFLPEARFTEVGRAPDGSTFVMTLGVEDFIRDATDIFAKEPFFE